MQILIRGLGAGALGYPAHRHLFPWRGPGLLFALGLATGPLFIRHPFIHLPAPPRHPPRPCLRLPSVPSPPSAPATGGSLVLARLCTPLSAAPPEPAPGRPSSPQTRATVGRPTFLPPGHRLQEGLCLPCSPPCPQAPRRTGHTGGTQAVAAERMSASDATRGPSGSPVLEPGVWRPLLCSHGAPARVPAGPGWCPTRAGGDALGLRGGPSYQGALSPSP